MKRALSSRVLIGFFPLAAFTGDHPRSHGWGADVHVHVHLHATRDDDPAD
jgi:hypothetical protein